MSFKALQRRSKKTEMSEKTGKFKKKKRFGKSLSNRAPALLIEIINRKLEYIGKNIIKIDTFKVKGQLVVEKEGLQPYNFYKREVRMN